MKISTIRWLDENGQLVSSGKMGCPSADEFGELSNDDDIVALGRDFAQAVAKANNQDVSAFRKPTDVVLADAGFVLLFLERSLKTSFGDGWEDAMRRIRFVQIDTFLPLPIERAMASLVAHEQGDVIDKTVAMLQKYTGAASGGIGLGAALRLN